MTTSKNETQQEQPNSEDGWISVKEKLPEFSLQVLTITEDTEYRILHYGSIPSGFPSLVTHWMLLPKPPKHFSIQRKQLNQ